MAKVRGNRKGTGTLHSGRDDVSLPLEEFEARIMPRARRASSGTRHGLLKTKRAKAGKSGPPGNSPIAVGCWVFLREAIGTHQPITQVGWGEAPPSEHWI
jgi:hypothetical protein